MAATQSTRDVIEAIERQVILPDKSAPISNYARLYARGPSGKVIGLYFVPNPRSSEAVCSQGQFEGTVKTVDCAAMPKSKWESVEANERRWVGQLSDLPIMSDGGCSIVNITYDTKRNLVESATCNGPG